MNMKIYKELVDQLKKEGVKVEDLTLKQISKSLELYRKIS